MGEVSINKTIRFEYECYMEGRLCTTKVYMLMDNYGTRAEKAYYDFLSIARQDGAIKESDRQNGSKYDGSHWDTPQVIAVEQIEDIQMSDEMEQFIKMVNAEPCSEED